MIPYRERKNRLVAFAIYSGAIVIGYTYLCRAGGYRMVAPFASNDGTIFYKTIGGKILRAELVK